MEKALPNEAHGSGVSKGFKDSLSVYDATILKGS